MPRRNRARREDVPPIRFAGQTAPIAAPSGWLAKMLSSGQVGKEYVCPRCARPVPGTSQHVVAWEQTARMAAESEDPSEEARSGSGSRGRGGAGWDGRGGHRHWHATCWTSAVREGIERYRY